MDKKMTVLVVEPGKPPYPKEIDSGLRSLQQAIGGDIEVCYPFADPVGLVLNDEGKINGKPLNRALRDEDGNIYDIIAGTFLVVGLGDEDIISLSPELVKVYQRRFRRPEVFISLNGCILGIPMEEEPNG